MADKSYVRYFWLVIGNVWMALSMGRFRDVAPHYNLGIFSPGQDSLRRAPCQGKFSFGAWFAMTLTGGIATGLITYGVNEPIIIWEISMVNWKLGD